MVRDADGNDYIDLTAGFGVSMAGHANAAVADAIAAQARRLPHALGDVHPAEAKVRLLEVLARLAPGSLGVSILASSGAEAVEAALKTAMLKTGRPGILAFDGAYHGLTYGALAATWRPDFRGPFQPQLFPGVRFAPWPADGPGAVDEERRVIQSIERILAEAERSDWPIGAILAEPILGRGGLIVPTTGFLPALRQLCDGASRLLLLDEVYTGFGRTGRWFACEHWDVVPDVLIVGKALGGGVPLSAAIGTPDAMAAWPASTGEAIHTSTFLGNPIACAAALAHLEQIQQRGLVERAARIGAHIQDRVALWAARMPAVAGVRGLGLLQAITFHDPGEQRSFALAVADEALRRGVLALAEGSALDVLALTPPAVITDGQLDHALDVIETVIGAVSP